MYVSYLVIQRLGPSIWTSCHRQHGPQQLTWRPSKQDMFNIASGMLKVGLCCRRRTTKVAAQFFCQLCCAAG